MKKNLPQLLLAGLLGFSAVQVQAQTVPVTTFKQMKARSVGPAAMSGRITAIDAVVSNPEIIYVGAASGGVWKSENGGISFSPIFDDQPNINIGSLAIQQSNPQVIWAGTGEGNPRNSINMGNGIYKSIDGGKTWKHMGLDKTMNIHRIIIDPTNPEVVYAGVIGLPFGDHPERGLYKTTNGGKTWERVLFTNERSGVAEMAMDPSNPNKLVVAMWEHHRTPWDFTSGGPGSGLYITHDGGKTWSKKGAADGLPAGNFGRLGLAISRSMPNRIYALVEASKNGLYRSDDGGEKWTKVTEDPAIVTNRAFYFNEIYVDPKNENRIYMLYQPVAVSEDGGKSFKVTASMDQVHADHQAFWIHPENPNLLIDGNDGGVAISRDRGKTWMFPETLPVGQFYHVNVDNEVPYNIYGGLQDNGSWSGPAYSFLQGGLRNNGWTSLLGGDGFDVAPDPEDSRYGYAMSQGGSLTRYDKKIGDAHIIKPTSPDINTKLRFNWNAAIAIDPFNKNGVYYGSQFLHKTADEGLTWQTLSPDLTRNNPEQQKQNESGGLSLDVTSAENHNTILTIAPSAVQEGVIWVGTDDGHVQVTRDGGKTWTNVRDRLPSLPKEAWIPQITASRHRAGEAFVVANDYRFGKDFSPYIYRTTDFGKSWTRLVDDKKVRGYALSFLQDPTEPRLMFAGTEHGLWVSIDEGKNWSQWTNGLPSVPTMDLAIQEREADLVIGTFGRSIYVLDNIRPLRQLASTQGKILNKQLAAFAPSDAYLANYGTAPGHNSEPDNLYQATNKPRGAELTYYIQRKPTTPVAKPSKGADKTSKPKKAVTVNKETGDVQPTATGVKVPLAATKTAKTDTLVVNIFNEEGKQIRTLKEVPDSTLGVQRLTWNLTEKGVRQPAGAMGARRGNTEPSGNPVLPGKYKLVFQYAGAKDSTLLTVQADPRLPFNQAHMVARRALNERLNQSLAQITAATDRLQEATEATEAMMAQLKAVSGKEAAALQKATKVMQDSLKAQREAILGKGLTRQGYGRPYQLTAVTKLREASSYVNGRSEAITATETQLVDQAESLTRETLAKVSAFFNTQWAEYRKQVQATPLTVIKDYQEAKPIM